MSTIEQNLQGAWERFQAGELDGAQKWVDSVLAKQPFNTKALQLSAMILSAQGEHLKAMERLTTALQRAPDDAELLNTMGNIQKATGDMMRAELAYRMAVKRAPDMIGPRQNLAMLLLGEHMPHLALEHLKILIQAQPDNARYRQARIFALKDMNRFDDARSELDALGDDRMRKGEAHVLRCQLALLTQDLDALLGQARSAQIDDHSGARAISLAAQGLSMAGKNAQLDKFFEEVIKAEPGPLSWAAIARAERARGRISTAVKRIADGLKVHPKNPDLLAERAEARLEMGQAEEAYHAAFQALEIAPGHAAALPVYARTALASGRPTEAQVAADTALSGAPNHQFWWAVRATGGRLNGQDYKFYYNYDRFVRPYTLPVPEGFDSLEEFNVALKERLDTLHEYSSAPLDQSLRTGTQTGPDLRFVNDPVLKAYFAALDGPIRDYMAHIGQDPRHILSRRNTGHYRLSGAWSVRLHKDGFHVNHVHPQGWISSAYYVDVPEEVETSQDKSGWIGFGAPPLDIPMLTTPEHYVKPEAGKLVLFPSYMWHGTVPIKSGATRMTLPFDVVPAPPPTP